MTLPRLMMDVYEEHLSEASFLWTRWERSLVAPDADLSVTATREERLLAHLDGLALGGPEVAERLLIPACESGTQSEVSSAAFSLLASGGDGAKRLLAWLEASEAPDLVGIQRALELEDSLAPAALLSLLSSSRPEIQALGLEVLVFRRDVPSTVLERFLPRDDPRLQSVALLGLEGRLEGLGRTVLHAALDSPHVRVRNAALVSGLLSNSRRAWERCQRWAKEHSMDGEEARVLMCLGGSGQDVSGLVELLEVPALRPSVLWALGFSGRVAAADACLAWMQKDEGAAALAGEAFCAITGLRLEGPYVVSPPEEGTEEPIPFEVEDLDAELVPGPEAALATPAPDAVAAWWREARARFDPGFRYLRGVAFSAQSLLDALRQEPMRRRGVLALELAIRSRGQFRLEPRAFTRRQASELARALAAPTAISTRRFDGMMTQG